MCVTIAFEVEQEAKEVAEKAKEATKKAGTIENKKKKELEAEEKAL